MTDEEKDIEEAIKSTELEPSAVGDRLATMVFLDILRDTKIRYEVNKQDYDFSRILDGKLTGRTHELSLQVISPLHLEYDHTDTHIAQGMGMPELLLIMAGDKRLDKDLRLYLQTEKYVQHEQRSSLTESRKRLLAEKSLLNNERQQQLLRRVEKCLAEGDFFLNGTPLKVPGQQAPIRLRAAFQFLVQYAYPRLEELQGDYREEAIPVIIRKRHDDLFQGDEASLTVPEQEILDRLRRNKARAEKTTLRSLLDAMIARPYGWYQAGILVMVARLYKRGLIELYRQGALLEDGEVMESLRNNRLFALTTLAEVAHVDPAKLRELRAFYQDFFHETCPEQEPKAAALVLRDRLKAENQRWQAIQRQAAAYPFLQALQPIVAQLDALQAKPYDYFLSHFSEVREGLLDTREDVLDPIEQFLNGTQREIYDEVRDFLNRGEANLGYLGEERVAPLRRLLEHPHPYRGGHMQQAKRDLEAAKDALLTLVQQERQNALSALDALDQKIASAPDFGQLDAMQREKVRQPFAEARQTLEKTRLIPVIRDRLNHCEQEAYPRALDLITRLARPAPTPEPSPTGDTPPPPPRITYVMRDTIKPPFAKPYLETETEVDTYLQQLRERYLRVIREGKRISL